jgi:trans-2-enoyl-CoA reductase
MSQVCTFSDPAISGQPLSNILHFHEEPIPECPTDRLLLQMLSAPVNPLDLLVLQDKYAVKPENSATNGGWVPGYDGMARVCAVGSSVPNYRVGDHVIIARHGLGTWRTHLLASPADVLAVPSNTSPEFGALLRMGVTPAHLLLTTAGSKLKPGDWIIQNAATGVIAHFVTQFARLRGFCVISVIRDRDDVEAAKLSLQDHGTNVIITESQLDDDSIFQDKNIMLGLDAVFGRLAERMALRMAKNSTFCSYGFLSGLGPEAHIKITPQLIWINKITFEGFRMSQTLNELSKTEQQELVTSFANLEIEGRLPLPQIETVHWRRDALADIARKLKDVVREKSDVSKVGLHKSVIRFEYLSRP